MDVKLVKRCRVCGEEKLTGFFSFGKIPLPNGFLNPEDLHRKENRYPLRVCSCGSCGLVQLLDLVNPEIMFRNYVYIPSTSKTRMQNFLQIVDQARALINLTNNSLVVDIGSNDGSLLSFFKGYGIKTLGIDPATNLVKIAQLKGIETINDYISVPLAKKIRKKYGPAKIVTATNVVAHIQNLHELFRAVEILLDKNGIFICEFPYLLDLVEKNQFDTIYHEHLSYFSVKPLMRLTAGTKLTIHNILRTPIDGGSLRVFFKKTGIQKNPQASPFLVNFIAEENAAGIYDLKTLKEFNLRVKRIRQQLRRTLTKFKQAGMSIAGYGAAAKGNILLNYCGIDNRLIDFMVDSTPYKQGLYTPGTHIPIYPEIEIQRRKPDYTLILAWNFTKEIVDKEKKYQAAGGKFIVPVPRLTVL